MYSKHRTTIPKLRVDEKGGKVSNDEKNKSKRSKAKNDEVRSVTKVDGTPSTQYQSHSIKPENYPKNAKPKLIENNHPGEMRSTNQTLYSEDISKKIKEDLYNDDSKFGSFQQEWSPDALSKEVSSEKINILGTNSERNASEVQNGVFFGVLKDNFEDRNGIQSVIHLKYGSNKESGSEEFEPESVGSLNDLSTPQIENTERFRSHSKNKTYLIKSEESSYNEVNKEFTWKIENFEKHKSDSQGNKKVSIMSDPFYTGIPGYKMCVIVYPFGDFIGRGTYLSVYFALMKGEFDQMLEWPFRDLVTISILDQDTGSQPINRTLKPPSNSNRFERPFKTINPKVGWIKFLSLDHLLNSSKYCRDDTIYMRVHIDDFGLE